MARQRFGPPPLAPGRTRCNRLTRTRLLDRRPTVCSLFVCATMPMWDKRWGKGVPIPERGPGWTYRPDERPPTVFGAHQPGIVTPHLTHA